MTENHDAGDGDRSAVAEAAPCDDTARDRLRSQARVVAKDLQELGGIARDVAQEKLGQLRSGTARYYERTRGKARQAEEAVEKFIGQRPIASVLLGLGLGLLFGRFGIRR